MKKLNFDHMQETIVRDSADIFSNPSFIEYRKNWTEYPDTFHVSNFPMNLDIHVTNRCNLRCVMCRRTLQSEKGLIGKTGFLDFELYKKIVAEAAREGCCAIHLSGNGETLLHNNIVEMIEYAHKLGIMDVFMHSNATLLSRELANEILQAGLTRIIFSVDSPVPETYEKIRVGAKFDVVVDNIRYFANRKKELNLQYPLIRIQMVEMKENEEEIEEFDRFFGDIVDSLGHISYVNYLDLDTEDRSIGEKKYRKDFICPALWQRLSVEWDGEVYACLITGDEGIILGNAFDKPIKEMWHGGIMSNLRDQHKNGKFSKIDSCEKCGRQYKA